MYVEVQPLSSFYCMLACCACQGCAVQGESFSVQLPCMLEVPVVSECSMRSLTHCTRHHCLRCVACNRCRRYKHSQVGGRSVVNADIAQFVEIRPEADRFLRLLEILGEWYEVGKIIIFVHTQDKCDNLFRDLLKVGGLCLEGEGVQ